METAVTAAEQKVNEATHTRVEKDVSYWRLKEMHLRSKEKQLRDELKRKEEQLQGGKLSFICLLSFSKVRLVLRHWSVSQLQDCKSKKVIFKLLFSASYRPRTCFMQCHLP